MSVDDVCNILNIVTCRHDELDRLESALKKKYHSNLIAGRSKQEIIDDAKAHLVTALVTVTNDIHALGSNLDQYITAQEDLTVALHSKIDILTDRITSIKQQKTDESLNSWRLDRHTTKDLKDNTSYFEDVNDVEKVDDNYMIDRISIEERFYKLETNIATESRPEPVFKQFITKNKAVDIDRKLDNKLFI